MNKLLYLVVAMYCFPLSYSQAAHDPKWGKKSFTRTSVAAEAAARGDPSADISATALHKKLSGGRNYLDLSRDNPTEAYFADEGKYTEFKLDVVVSHGDNGEDSGRPSGEFQYLTNRREQRRINGVLRDLAIKGWIKPDVLADLLKKHYGFGNRDLALVACYGSYGAQRLANKLGKRVYAVSGKVDVKNFWKQWEDGGSQIFLPRGV
jgi:hypothetical protein